MKSISLNNFLVKEKDIFTFRVNFTILITFSLFYFIDVLRESTHPYLSGNLLFLLFSSTLILISVFRKGINYGILVIALLFTVIVGTNILLLDFGANYIFMSICNLFLPLFLLSIRLQKQDAINATRTFLRAYNFLIILLIIVGIIDYITSSSIQLYFAETIFNGTKLQEFIYLEQRWGIYRYYSFMGHPLQNAKYVLIFYIMNNVISKYHKPTIKLPYVSIITIVGLLLSNSKTAIVIGLVLILFFSNIKRFKILYLSLIMFAGFIFTMTPLFKKGVLERFITSADNLTSGRNDLLSLLLQSNITPDFFSGGGSSYSREIVKMIGGYITNFEYPPIMFSFDYGIIPTVILYLLILVIPAVIFIKNRSWYILFSFLSLSLFINTSNGIAELVSDGISQLCFITILLIGLSQRESTKQERI